MEWRDEYNRTLLHWAILGCKKTIFDDLITRLLHSSQSISRSLFINHGDNQGNTALHYALSNSNKKHQEHFVRILLHNGATPLLKNAVDQNAVDLTNQPEGDPKTAQRVIESARQFLKEETISARNRSARTVSEQPTTGCCFWSCG
jgi:ankyrin repeat protein